MMMLLICTVDFFVLNLDSQKIVHAIEQGWLDVQNAVQSPGLPAGMVSLQHFEPPLQF